MLYPLSYGCVLPIVAVLRAGQPPEFQQRPPEALRRPGGRAADETVVYLYDGGLPGRTATGQFPRMRARPRVIVTWP